ncbi:hypothetical protein TVAG_362960 [Trichomonas vaginalis G3]|uniref:Uncharacterized protein n=1 Tax=Trichomonas vaginalis (strain ATCC PRA-98 / G3) TaxID=412133 RepID=A2G342_TRIV3|nr:Ankyrin repeat family [Trichomonas vaginalis G3]EAX88422.1 hypothetical protein TVAG_362960 [Trichomonas vaginalis G3]KAI5505345.1 Ankyrin repeat family [Trichomonas vaginalis G3]|eukprot:XP_001301352.1 hypothetical protein [Trichomonas vaginalis G3]
MILSSDIPYINSKSFTDLLSVAHIQQQIYSLKKSSLHDLEREIKNLISKPMKVKSIFKMTLESVSKNTVSLPSYAELLSFIIKNGTFISKSTDLKHYIVQKILLDAGKTPDAYKSLSLIQLLYYLSKDKDISSETILSMFVKLYKQGKFTFLSSLYFFAVFCKELHDFNQQIYRNMYNILIRAKQNKALPAILDSFVENFQIFQHNDFIHSNKLIEAILSDNVDEFISVCSMPDFNFNQPAPFYLLFAPKLPCQSPSLIDLVAFVGSEGCFRYLINNVQKSSINIDSLARCAVASGIPTIVRLSQQIGCNVSSIIDVAAEYHRVQLIQWMLDYNPTTKSLSDACNIAASTDDIVSLSILIQETGINGTPVHLAAKNKSFYCLSLFKLFNTKFDSIDSTGSTPLHYAVLSKSRRCVQLVKYLISDINATDFCHYSALDLAKLNNLTKIVELFNAPA